MYIYIYIYIYISKFTKKCHRLPRPWSGDNIRSKLANIRTYIYTYIRIIYQETS